MESRFFPDPSILIDCSIKNGPTTIGIDRSCQCGHFGLCTFLRKCICFTKTCWDVGFFDVSMIVCQIGCKVSSIRGMNGKSGHTALIRAEPPRKCKHHTESAQTHSQTHMCTCRHGTTFATVHRQKVQIYITAETLVILSRKQDWLELRSH